MSHDPTWSEINKSTPAERARWEASIAEEFLLFEDMETWKPDDHP